MKLKLVNKIKESSDVVSFVFEPEEPIIWQAGQYFHYVLHHEPTDDRGSDRWFTISSAPFEKHIQITTRHAQDKSSSFKTKLFDLPLGKTIETSHLEGDFVIDDPSKDYIFIAGGIGITPFRSILKQLDHNKKEINVTLLYANSNREVVFKDELEEIASHNSKFMIHYVFSPEHIDKKKISVILEAKPIESLVYYVSGPEPMVESLIKMLKNMGVAESHIKGDWFPNYQAF